jgi:hypothetical protein
VELREDLKSSSAQAEATMSKSDAVDVDQTEKIRNQGREHGLFRSCMDIIRSSHRIGQTLRTAALTAGLLTDANCYAELLGQFYVVTSALEQRMQELILLSSAKEEEVNHSSSSSSPAKTKTKHLLVAKVKALGYSFSHAYARDLHALLGTNWLDIIQSWTSEPAMRYIQKLQCATDAECVAAAFILYGPLVIGGGAVLKPRVEKAFGVDATNVYTDVTGSARGGRSQRRREFIDFYDTLLDGDDDNEYTSSSVASPSSSAINNGDSRSGSTTFVQIVDACGEFMEMNNQMMVAVKQTPWWKKYVTSSMVVVASALIWMFKASSSRK